MELWWLLPTILLGGSASWLATGALTYRFCTKVFDPEEALKGKPVDPAENEFLKWTGPVGLLICVLFTLWLVCVRTSSLVLGISGATFPKKLFLWLCGDGTNPKRKKLLQDSDEDSLKKLPEGIGVDSNSSL